MNKTIHQGRNIKRFRELLRMKQESLAWELGEDWSQKRVSMLEQKEVVEQDILDKVAQILKVPAEAIKNFDEDQAITVISSTFNDNAAVVNNNPIFNPIDRLLELHEDKISLYERMLKEKDEMIAKIEKIWEVNRVKS